MVNPSTSKRTTFERKSERELVVMRWFDSPAHIVFDAWTKSELLTHWWAPKSTGMPLRCCEADVRVGGRYRLEFSCDVANPMVFFGSYIEVMPHSRLVWANEESGDCSVTTVTFEEDDDKTPLVLDELYDSKEALDVATVGMEDAIVEQFEQLEELLVTLPRS